MAGAKETPRQKMIGMMYLVLTALLALNVSKSVLDAFVAIEENMQKANLTELFRGDERKDQIQEAALDLSNPIQAEKAKLLLKSVEDLDKMTQERIDLLDELKLKILEECGEDIGSVGNKASILMEKKSKDGNPLKPIRMNLEYVAGKDKYDEAMRIMIGQDIKKPTGDGMKLWESINGFRKEITQLVASSQLGAGDNPSFDKSYYFKAPEINKFKDQRELNKKIEEAIKASNVHPEDRAMIAEIYSSLSKEEFSTVHDVKDVHWIGKTFDHAPVVAAIASLSSLQKDVLSARADALTLLRSRVMGSEFSFNTIIPLARGPEVVNQGEEFQLEVMMAVYDKDKQPEVTIEGGEVSEVKDGKGIIKLRGQGNTMDLKGTVSISNRSGIKRTLNWEKTVTVMKPSGSIELPQLNVLYRGYDNKVNATASGFPNTILSGSGASLAPTSDGMYNARPSGNGRTASLTVSGRTADGRTVALKTVQYRVLNLPKPTMYWGAAADGERANPREKNLFAKYGADVPLDAKFRIISWEMSVAGAIRPVRDTGNKLNTQAQNLLNAAPSGSRVFYSLQVMGPDNVRRNLSGSFKI
ncbi:MAG: GldM family protein [Crocinitomicaceae bacterium]